MMSLEKVTYGLIMAFPVVIISVKILGPLIYVLLALIGIYWTISRRVSPFSIRELRLFSWLTFGYFIVMALSVALSNEPTNDWIHLSRKIQFLVAPFVGLSFYYAKIPREKILLTLKIGLVVIGIIVWVEWLMGDYGSRLSGMFNPNTFGDIAVVMLWMAMSSIDRESIREYRYSVFSMFLGSFAVAMSGSRASMLVYIILMLIYLVLMYRGGVSGFRLLGIFLAGVSSFGLVMLLNGSVLDRANQATQEVSQWSRGQNKTSSVGVRLEMYRTGWQAFIDAPWGGYGYRNANSVAARYAEEPESKDIVGYTHLHNEYLTNMVSAGLMGLVALMMLFLIPLWKFVKYAQDTSVGVFSKMGIFLISGYMLLGLTHGMLEWEYENSLFLFYLGYFLIGICEERVV